MQSKLKDFTKRLNIENINLDLLKCALSHTSYTKEQNIEKNFSYERLEFLGDSVLKLASSKYLYQKFPQSLEGELTKIRAHLVSDNTLAKFSETLKIKDVILLSDAEEKDGGRNKKMILACAFESLLGAIFLTYGYEFCEKFLENIYSDEINSIAKNLDNLNPKGKLQELLQKEGKNLPEYRIINEFGASHKKIFECEIYIDDIAIAKAQAKTKKEAESLAAEIAYKKLEKNNGK